MVDENATATAALREIAQAACDACAVTLNHRGNPVTYKCSIGDVSDVRFNIIITVNAVCTKKIAQDILSKTRAAIREAAIAQNIKWRYPRTRAAGGGKTWVHNTGFWHMNQFCETDRYATFIGGESGRAR